MVLDKNVTNRLKVSMCNKHITDTEQTRSATNKLRLVLTKTATNQQYKYHMPVRNSKNFPKKTECPDKSDRQV